ncbi:putative phosphohydrolase [Desulfosporosinus acidiphilus SJ4]|uniref:Putative phosphohydrolase n=1 Tax=Desulfosporosinus acidiphilus (strain DSM 22704 / JCM 16185 / SJ4) TaxID=646529 RepID=I4DAH2_DESAJ|nr:metallophosphoesterase [Desulfosporosinus acidiphilus]AFM42796.1 putative phosphohydrolase [Desulfosporosinus acidiphilus SJ4]
MRKKWLVLILLVIGLGVTSAFILHSYKNFKVQQGFVPLPLSFDPYTSVSTYDWNGNMVSIEGGFVKGKIADNSNQESLLLRSLSPTPVVSFKSGIKKSYGIRLENVNPAMIKTRDQIGNLKAIDPHTISFTVDLQANQLKTIKFELSAQENPEVIMLGDNRNGYGTFSNIIDQVNAIKPAFVVDNGDLVYGGEPNRYRLFYETVSKLQVPLYTTLGNHDIRENGLPIYTELFGPAYYSFDYLKNHFIFLDSSRGWTEKTAISPEQYRWLEADLQNAQDKRIFVVSHIPPTDPRANVTPNTYPESQKTGVLQKLMNKLSGTSDIDHAFNDKAEAKKFEDLMTKYKVDTVFLSHIHSFFSFVRGNVRYIITGGAGAELLSEGSEYHYIRVHITDDENYLEIVELPSPPNQIIDRYWAAAQLFLSSTYKEYSSLVLAIGLFLVLILGWILWVLRLKWWPFLKKLGRWIYEVAKLSILKYKEIVRNK